MEFSEWMIFAEAANFMNGFRSWYDYNRGAWTEVESAARQDPSIQALVNQIQRGLTDFTQAGAWGDKLEAAVERIHPKHSKRKARAQWEKDQLAAHSRVHSPSKNPQQTNQPHFNNDFTKMVSDHERRLRSLEARLSSQPQSRQSYDADATQVHQKTAYDTTQQYNYR